MRKHPAVASIVVLLNVGLWFLAIALLVTLGAGLIGRGVVLRIDNDGLPSVDIRQGGLTLAVPVAFSVDAQEVVASAAVDGVSRPQITGARGILEFGSRQDGFFAANLAFVIAMDALLFWVVWELRGLFRTLRAGEPFAPANALRVRRIGWAVLLIQVARALAVYLEHQYVREHFTASGLQFNAVFSIGGIVPAVIILVIAEVFRAGTQLADEQRLTV